MEKQYYILDSFSVELPNLDSPAKTKSFLKTKGYKFDDFVISKMDILNEKNCTPHFSEFTNCIIVFKEEKSKDLLLILGKKTSKKDIGYLIDALIGNIILSDNPKEDYAKLFKDLTFFDINCKLARKFEDENFNLEKIYNETINKNNIRDSLLGLLYNYETDELYFEDIHNINLYKKPLYLFLYSNFTNFIERKEEIKEKLLYNIKKSIGNDLIFFQNFLDKLKNNS